MSWIKKIINRINVVSKQDLPVDTNTYGFEGRYKKDIFLLHNASIASCHLEGKHEFGCNTLVQNCSIGLATYIAHNSQMKFTNIGRFCSIGENVRTFVGQHPTKDFVSTHPVFFSKQKIIGTTFADKQYFAEHTFLDEKYVVEIGNDVWIGNNVTILDGVRIGDGAIIASGAIVTGDVAPYAIVGGLPAKVLKFRFEEAEIKRLMEVKWWNWEFDKIRESYKDFHSVSDFLRKQSN